MGEVYGYIHDTKKDVAPKLNRVEPQNPVVKCGTTDALFHRSSKEDSDGIMTHPRLLS